MKKMANTTKTAELVSRIVGQMIQSNLRPVKTASQSFDSVSNSEASRTEQHVTNKLKHQGEDYAKAEMTSYGLQQTRDLLGQGPNVGPLPDKASSDQAENRSSLNDTKSNPLYDVFDAVGEPTENIDDPGTQGDSVSEKLQLKKDASAILTRMDDVNKQGQKIIDYLMHLTVDSKEASVAPPMYTQEELVTQASQLASADALTHVKAAMLHSVDDAIYAAEAAALYIKKAEAEEEVENAMGPVSEETAPANVGAPQAMAAMSEPAPAADMGGEPPISEEEAQALMAQSLQENGIDPGMGAGGDPMGVAPMGDAGPDISAEDLAAFEMAMQQAGVSPEELQMALGELEAEQSAGITPETGAIADEEAAKTGHYKFSSFINRPVTKTAEQEQRAAVVRGAVRDFVYGPGTRNFN